MWQSAYNVRHSDYPHLCQLRLFHGFASVGFPSAPVYAAPHDSKLPSPEYLIGNHIHLVQFYRFIRQIWQPPKIVLPLEFSLLIIPRHCLTPFRVSPSLEGVRTITELLTWRCYPLHTLGITFITGIRVVPNGRALRQENSIRSGQKRMAMWSGLGVREYGEGVETERWNVFVGVTFKELSPTPIACYYVVLARATVQILTYTFI